MAATFISYRREDSAGYAGRLHEELVQRLGTNMVFRDADTIRAGQDFVAAIQERLSRCQTLVAVIGRDWLETRTASGERRLDQPDDYVAMEIAAALARPDVLLVPVLVGGATMPRPEQLPTRLKGMERRHALTLRDETWEADVDRLAAVLREHGGAAPASHTSLARQFGLRRRWMIWAGLAATVAVAVLVSGGFDSTSWLRSPPASEGNTAGRPLDGAGRTTSKGRAGPVDATVNEGKRATPTQGRERQGTSGAATDGGSYAIDVPRKGAEVAYGDVIYAPLSGSITPQGATSTFWLRIRASNDGPGDHNLWDSSFRLVVGGQVLTPTNRLNEILSGHSVRQELLSFEIPSGTSRAQLRVTSGREATELPLNLSNTGRPAAHEENDPGDAHSRATLVTLVAEPRPLIVADGLSMKLRLVTARRFVNKVRIVVATQLENTGQTSRYSGEIKLRLVHHDGQVASPVRDPNDPLAPYSTALTDIVFEILPSSNEIVLRAISGQKSTEVPLGVP